MALAGCDCRVESGPATTPWAPISASQVSPSSSALARLITTTAQAPSEIGEEVAAVIADVIESKRTDVYTRPGARDMVVDYFTAKQLIWPLNSSFRVLLREDW